MRYYFTAPMLMVSWILWKKRTCIVFLKNHTSPLRFTIFLSHGWLYHAQKQIWVLIDCLFYANIWDNHKNWTFRASQNTVNMIWPERCSSVTEPWLFLSALPTFKNSHDVYNLHHSWAIYGFSRPIYFRHSTVYIHWFFAFSK